MPSAFEKKRILQIANEPGPLRCFMLPTCRALKQQGATVELACMKTGANYEPLSKAGFTLHGITHGRWSKPGDWFKIASNVKSILKKGDYDLIVVHTPVMSWIVRFVARKFRAKVVYFAHGLPFTKLQPPLRRFTLRMVEKFCAKYTDAVIVMNEEDFQACRKYKLTRTGKNFFKIPGVGVDVDYWAKPLTDADAKQLNREFGLRDNYTLVLYLGRLIEAKRPFDIIELARRIGDKADFIIAGEGPLYEPLKKRAALLGGHVKVLGWTDKNRELIQRSSLVVFPSVFREGLPRFILEAQAAGKAVVAYDVRGVSDIIMDGQTGRLAAPCDLEKWLKNSIELFENPDMSEKMGMAGHEAIAAGFSLSSSVAYQIDFLEKTLELK